MRLSPILFAILFVILLIGSVAFGQTTYTWSGGSPGNWATAASWTPTRTTPAATDILVFNSSTVVTLDFTSPETIGQLQVTSNSYVVFVATAAHALNIAGGTGTDFQIDAGSSLVDSSNSAITVAIATGATGSASGSFVAKGASAATAHRLTASDASSLTFANGSLCNIGASFSGNIFGTTSLNSVVFASGSVYAQSSGSNPFGAAAPSSVVTFQAGSLFRQDGAFTPSFSGRTYANFEQNIPTTTTVTGGSAVAINNLTVTLGTLNFNMTATPGHAIKGNISVASGATLTFNPASAGTVNLNGSSAQTISGSGTLTTSSLSTLVLNNANGVSLQKDATINGTLTLTSGKIALGSNKLTIGATGSIASASSASYIVTDGSGVLTRNSVGGTDVTFPVGTATSYTPVTVNNAGTVNSFSVKVQATFDNAPVDPNMVVGRQWTITEAVAGGSNAILTFQWNSAEHAPGFSVANPIVIGRYTGTQWAEVAATLGGSDPYTATASGFTSFSPFAVGNVGSLPIQLSYFTGTPTPDWRCVRLNWRTLSEINNYGFYVQRSSDRVNFVTLPNSFVPGYGTTNEPHNYTYLDCDVTRGVWYYRLKQIDLDGTIYYTDAIRVELNVTTSVNESAPKIFELQQNYPNPFNPETRIRFSVETTGKATLRVYNLIGQEVATLFDAVAQAGRYYDVKFSGAKLTSGVYFYKLENGKNSALKKLMLVK